MLKYPESGRSRKLSPSLGLYQGERTVLKYQGERTVFLKLEESCGWRSGFLAMAGVWREAFLPTLWPEAGSGREG